MLKMNEIGKWDDVLIDNKVNELRKQLFDFRMQKGTSGIEKPHVIKVAKKNIARLLTVKNSKTKGEK